MKFIPILGIALAATATLADMDFAGSAEMVKTRVVGRG